MQPHRPTDRIQRIKKKTNYHANAIPQSNPRAHANHQHFGLNKSPYLPLRQPAIALTPNAQHWAGRHGRVDAATNTIPTPSLAGAYMPLVLPAGWVSIAPT